MRVKLIFALICLLLIIQTVSAENRVVNGGFETGDFTGWTVGWTNDNAKPEVTSDYKHNGSYSACLKAVLHYNSPADTWIRQDIDLTGVSDLTFYIYKPCGCEFKVTINGTTVFSTSDEYSSWTLIDVDVSDWSGVCSVCFNYNGEIAPIGDALEMYIDDVVAEAEIEVKNVTFNFIDDSTNGSLQNVWLNYSINEELYNATFNSGDSITVVNGNSIVIYEAKKYGYVSELEEFGYSLFYTITNDTTIEIHFHPAEGEWHYVELYFQDAKTGSLLDNVHLTATVSYQGETQTIDGIYDYRKTIWVRENSTVQVSMAHRDGYESELEKQGMSLVFTDVQEDLTYYIKFYEIPSPEIYANVHFIFIDVKTNAQIPDVWFTLKDSGDHVIVNGTYDYEFVLENAIRGQWYFYNASKSGYFPASGGYQVPTDSQTNYVYVYLTPVLTAQEENNTIVEFRILDSQTWDPVSGAVVTLNGVSKVTNSAGFTYFEVAKNNTYSYLVSAEGYYSKSGVVEVGTETVTKTVYLLKGGASVTPTSSGGEEEGDLRQTARDTLAQFYRAVPSFFNLIFLLFLMASMQAVMKGFRRR